MAWQTKTTICARRRPLRWSIDIDLKEVGGLAIAIFGRAWVKPSFSQLIIEVPLHIMNLAKHMVEMGWPKDGPQLCMRRLAENGAEQVHGDLGTRARGAGGGRWEEAAGCEAHAAGGPPRFQARR